MINRLRIILEQPEYSALIKLSGQEVRSPADQVVVIVRNELVRCGAAGRKVAIWTRHKKNRLRLPSRQRRSEMTKTNTLSPKPNDSASLPAELREIYDLLAAYGRKVRLAAIANGEQQKQANYQRMIADANEFISRMEKEEKRNGKSA